MFLPTNITLKLGDSGDFVSELQRRLSIVHCFNADAVNGFFDGNTVNGVSQFQSTNGIRADGIAGPETLRRLNGSLSGDTSSTEDHKAEEDALHQQQQHTLLLQQQLIERQMLEQQQLAEQQFAQQQLAQQQFAQQQQTTVAPQQPYAAASAPMEPVVAAVVYTQQTVTQQPPQYAQHMTPPQPAAPSATDILAEMLLQPQQAPHTLQTTPPTAHMQPIQQQFTPPQPVQQASTPQPIQHIQATATTPHAEQNTQAPAVQEPRSMASRAMHYASEMIQKLAHHFEKKLPASVLQEVKEIGHVMAQSGMKEVAIPTGPEQQRGPDAPSRGQQQGKQIS